MKSKITGMAAAGLGAAGYGVIHDRWSVVTSGSVCRMGSDGDIPFTDLDQAICEVILPKVETWAKAGSKFLPLLHIGVVHRYEEIQRATLICRNRKFKVVVKLVDGEVSYTLLERVNPKLP